MQNGRDVSKQGHWACGAIHFGDQGSQKFRNGTHRSGTSRHTTRQFGSRIDFSQNIRDWRQFGFLIDYSQIMGDWRQFGSRIYYCHIIRDWRQFCYRIDCSLSCKTVEGLVNPLSGASYGRQETVWFTHRI